MALYGRTVLYTDYDEITKQNIVEILNNVSGDWQTNVTDITTLYEYYTGKQDILKRVKIVRPEINNTTVVNIANQIVTFKTGYLIGEPVQYVSKVDDENVGRQISTLNGYMSSEGKSSKDIELADWMHICGQGYRIILPDADVSDNEDESPFETYVLDPRQTFVIYKNDMTKKPMLGVYVTTMQDGTKIYTCYSDTKTFVLNDATGELAVQKVTPHIMGGVPIIEYPLNNARIGAFEVVKDILDSINEIASDRTDAIESFVDALLVFKGVDIEAEEIEQLRQMGALKVPVDGDIKYLVQELNQQQTQTLVDYFYDTILTIVGMPSQGNGKTSDSSNNGAVILKNGWSDAEARAKATELRFDESEKRFLEIALTIAGVYKDTDLRISDIDIKFTRRNYENIESKAQVLISMLNNEKLNPQLAFDYSNMFPDPESAYLMSKPYIDKFYNLAANGAEIDDGTLSGGSTYVRGFFRSEKGSKTMDVGEEDNPIDGETDET